MTLEQLVDEVSQASLQIGKVSLASLIVQLVLHVLEAAVDPGCKRRKLLLELAQ